MTADPWAFLKNLAVAKLPKAEEKPVLALLEQARDFFEAASNPRVGSKPLLYYYSFLNLAKSALLIRGVAIPPSAAHGISDPRANVRKRLHVKTQKVRVVNRARNHQEVFPELVASLGGRARQLDLKVLDLLSQVPSIHRTFVSVSSTSPTLVPLKRIEILRDTRQVWARVRVQRQDKDVQTTIGHCRRRPEFARFFTQVASSESEEIWFETDPATGQRRGVDTAIRSLTLPFRNVGLPCIMTQSGYRFYFSTLAERNRLPDLAAGYAAMFYLGSVTRYKPDVFDKILSGGYSWIVEEFLTTYPLQFLYTLASELAHVDVVRPYAAMS